MSISKNLGSKSLKNNITIYSNDGMGRDNYISYNNGGFWKDVIIKEKEKYPKTPFSNYHSLYKIPPPFPYFSDGSGRDTYILCNNGGLVHKFLPNQDLSFFLRKNYFSFYSNKKNYRSQPEIKHCKLLYKIQKNLIQRLYLNEIYKKKNSTMNDFYRNNNFIYDQKKNNICTLKSSSSTPLFKSRRYLDENTSFFFIISNKNTIDAKIRYPDVKVNFTPLFKKNKIRIRNSNL